MPAPKKHLEDLYRLFVAIQNTKEAEMLLEDILTPQEIDSLAERWQLIRALDANVPQRKIAAKLHVSISKITRGSRTLQYGSGGFRHFLKKLKKSKR